MHEIPIQMTRRSSPSRATPGRDIPVGPRDRRDQFTVGGTETVARLRQVVREGNVIRMRIKDEDGRTLIEIPETLGVRGESAWRRSGRRSMRSHLSQGH